MGTTLHQKDGKATWSRHSGDGPMHVRIENLGFVTSTPGARQETHEVHDEHKTRWIGAEEDVTSLTNISLSSTDAPKTQRDTRRHCAVPYVEVS